MKIGPRQTKKNEKASSLCRLRQSTIAERKEKMRTSETECGREASAYEVEVRTFDFPSYARVHMEVKTCSFSPRA